MVEHNRSFRLESGDLDPKADMFSIDFYHVPTLIVVDLREGFDTGLASVFRKAGIIDKATLNVIEFAGRENRQPENEVLDRYAWHIFNAANQVRFASYGSRKVVVTISKGPIVNFFDTKRWSQLKAKFDGRLNYVNFANAIAFMKSKEESVLPDNLIQGNSLAGVLTMWESGDSPNLDLPEPLGNNSFLNN